VFDHVTLRVADFDSACRFLNNVEAVCHNR